MFPNEAMTVEIVEKCLPAVFDGKLVRRVDREAAVGMTTPEGRGISRGRWSRDTVRPPEGVITELAGVVSVIRDCLDVTEGPRIKMLSSLPLVATSLAEMIKVTVSYTHLTLPTSDLV